MYKREFFYEININIILIAKIELSQNKINFSELIENKKEEKLFIKKYKNKKYKNINHETLFINQIYFYTQK